MNKEFVKYTILKILANIASLFPKKYILFESCPDLSDNSLYVFEEMKRRGLDKKYNFVWVCTNLTKKRLNDGILYIPSSDKIQRYYYMLRSRCLISCNSFLQSFGKYQKSVFLTHGFGIKANRNYIAPPGIDFVTGISEIANEITAKELKMPVDKFIVTGFPRNDTLFTPDTEIIRQSLFANKYKKIIVWYPTFRQHNLHTVASASKNSLPIIHDNYNAELINKVASELGVLIILKPHFSQDTSFISDNGLSNIKIINDSYFKDNNITSYEFVAACDAMITDYSSIYFDYLLCNKPVAVIWEDIEQYKKNRGFALDVDEFLKGAFKIYNADQFISFLKQVSSGVDPMTDLRKQNLMETHKYVDNLSSCRVVDFIQSLL